MNRGIIINEFTRDLPDKLPLDPPEAFSTLRQMHREKLYAKRKRRIRRRCATVVGGNR